jgi:hypothetical protein
MISRRNFLLGCGTTAAVTLLTEKELSMPLKIREEVVKKTPLPVAEGVSAIGRHTLALEKSVKKYGKLKNEGNLTEAEFKNLTSVEFAERAASVLTWVASLGLNQLIQRLEVPEKVRYNLWMTANTGLVAHLNTHVYKIFLQAMEKDSEIQETQNYSICQWVKKIGAVSIAERKKLSHVTPIFSGVLADLKNMPEMCKTTRGKISNGALLLQHVLGLSPNIDLWILRFLRSIWAQQYVGRRQISMAVGLSPEKEVKRKAGVNAGTYPIEGIINGLCVYILKQQTLGFKDSANEKKAQELTSLLVGLLLFNYLKVPIDTYLMSGEKTRIPFIGKRANACINHCKERILKKLIDYCQPLQS